MNTYDPFTRSFMVLQTCTASALEAETKQAITAKDTIVYAVGQRIIPDKPVLARVRSVMEVLWEKNPPISPPEPVKTLPEKLEAAGVEKSLVDEVRALLTAKVVPLG